MMIINDGNFCRFCSICPHRNRRNTHNSRFLYFVMLVVLGKCERVADVVKNDFLEISKMTSKKGYEPMLMLLVFYRAGKGADF